MANPSLKNGYISIANELVEKLASVSIPASEMRLVWVVWRKTWGWQQGTRKKDWDWIALSQFEKMTGIKHANVVSGLKSLVCKRILIKEENRVKFNQNYDEWVVCKRIRPVCNNIPHSMQTHTKISMQTHTNKRKKETNTKETTSKGKPLHEFNVLGAEIIKEMETVDPKNKTYYGNTTQRKACDFLLDEYGLEEVKKRISVLPRTNKIPYFPTITTPLQLKEKWVQLQDAVERKRGELQEKNKVAFI